MQLSQVPSKTISDKLILFTSQPIIRSLPAAHRVEVCDYQRSKSHGLPWCQSQDPFAPVCHIIPYFDSLSCTFFITMLPCCFSSNFTSAYKSISRMTNQQAYRKKDHTVCNYNYRKHCHTASLREPFYNKITVWSNQWHRMNQIYSKYIFPPFS